MNGLVVLVCRSSLDRGVWFTYSQGAGLDLSDFEFPGRSGRWTRLDADTYELEMDQ